MSKSTTNSIARPATPGKVSTQIVLKSIEKKAAPLLRKLTDFKIKTSEDKEKAIVLVKELKELGKEADRQLRTVTDPLKEATKAANEIFKPFFRDLMDVETRIKAELLDYQLGLDKKKIALNVAFEDKSIKKASTYLKKSAELEDDSNVRNVWQAIAVNEKLTPREYLVADEGKIKEALKAGKKVAGWKWEQVKTVVI